MEVVRTTLWCVARWIILWPATTVAPAGRLGAARVEQGRIPVEVT